MAQQVQVCANGWSPWGKTLSRRTGSCRLETTASAGCTRRRRICSFSRFRYFPGEPASEKPKGRLIRQPRLNQCMSNAEPPILQWDVR